MGLADTDELQTELERLGRRGHEAMVVGISRHGRRTLRAWSAHDPRPDANSVFEVGSITKALTGVLLADMSLRGEVALDDPLSRHLPSPRPAWRHREPTLVELATHRSGLPNVPRGLQRAELLYALGFGERDPWADVTRGEYERLVAIESPRRRPGGRPAYSSMGVGLLGDALAARAGIAYGDLLAERVLRPLGMESTTLAVHPPDPPRVMAGHSRRGCRRPPLEDLMPAAGGARSSAEDLLRFLEANLAPPTAPPGPAIALAQRARVRMGRRHAIGLCWMLSRRPDRATVIWHNGGTWGFRGFAGFSPPRRSACVVLANTARGVESLGFRILEGG